MRPAPTAARIRPARLAASLVAASLVAASGAAPAVAAEGPSFDCARAESGAETLVCADPARAAMDRRLAARYAAALKAAEGLGAGAAEATDLLRATQRGWIGGRDDCWTDADLRACVEAAYVRRSAELVALWLLEPAAATALWRCADGAEIAATLFAAEGGALRLERGDRVDWAAQTPAASGSRYEGAFGLVFWEKGADAAFRAADPEGAETTCRRA
jgi:uncharacterized protein